MPGRGYRLAEPVEFLDAHAIVSRLGPVASRVRLTLLDEVDSTSTRLASLAQAGAPSGTCVAAEWQRAGRGRRGRTLAGGAGGLAHLLAPVALRAGAGPPRRALARGGGGGGARARARRRRGRRREVAQRPGARLEEARRHPRRDLRRDARAHRGHRGRGAQLPAGRGARATHRPARDRRGLVRRRRCPRATRSSPACSPSWSPRSSASRATASPPFATSGRRAMPTPGGA